MEVKVHDIGGKAVGKANLSDDIFNQKLNDHVLHLVVKAYQANRRQGTHATKTRSLIRGGGKKPFKQKGTGNARQGSTRSPNHVGGAIAHGPQPRDYTQQINKKTKKLATKVALSNRAQNNALYVIDDFKMTAYKTKSVNSILSNLKIEKAVFVGHSNDDYMLKSTGNIHGAEYYDAKLFNAENVLRYPNLVISKSAIDAITARFEGAEA